MQLFFVFFSFFYFYIIVRNCNRTIVIVSRVFFFSIRFVKFRHRSGKGKVFIDTYFTIRDGHSEHQLFEFEESVSQRGCIFETENERKNWWHNSRMTPSPRLEMTRIRVALSRRERLASEKAIRRIRFELSTDVLSKTRLISVGCVCSRVSGRVNYIRCKYSFLRNTCEHSRLCVGLY